MTQPGKHPKSYIGDGSTMPASGTEDLNASAREVLARLDTDTLMIVAFAFHNAKPRSYDDLAWQLGVSEAEVQRREELAFVRIERIVQSDPGFSLLRQRARFVAAGEDYAADGSELERWATGVIDVVAKKDV